VAAFGCDELRDEGEEEQGGFWIEGFGEDSLLECGCRGWADGVCCGTGRFGEGVFRYGDVTGADHFDAEEDEIGGAGVLDGMEGHGGGGEDGRDAESCGEDVEKPAKEGADGGLEAFATASGEGAGEHVEDAGAGSDGEEESGGEEEEQAVGVEHAEIVRETAAGEKTTQRRPDRVGAGAVRGGS